MQAARHALLREVALPAMASLYRLGIDPAEAVTEKAPIKLPPTFAGRAPDGEIALMILLSRACLATVRAAHRMAYSIRPSL